MRQFSFLMLAAALCLPMVGCGGDAATTDAKDDAPATTPEDGSGDKADEGEEASTEEAAE